MNSALFQKLTLGDDAIYSASEWGTSQEEERRLRKQVADKVPTDLTREIAIHHSFSVMDQEVEAFVDKLPKDAIVLDVGGCWGWHWRNIDRIRPDIKVIIMDFVRENLEKAHFFLGHLINKSIFLVHGDGTKIPFGNNVFDGYWAVQTLQHIPVLESAVAEAHRVLKPRGIFSMINLNNPYAIKLIYKLLGRPWVDQGNIDGMYFFRRSSKFDEAVIRKVFGNSSRARFTEILFKPELNIHGPAAPNNWLGKLDAMLSSSAQILSLLARQRGYSAIKSVE